MSSLDELLVSVKQVRGEIRGRVGAEAQDIETLLDISARHVCAARLGMRLFDDPRPVAHITDDASAQIGALLLVFGAGKTSIDLCSSALLRWHGQRPNEGREHDFKDLRKAIGSDRVALTSGQQRWFESVDSMSEGKQLVNFRNAVVHRLVRQDVTVGSIRSTRISFDGADPTEEAIDLLNRVASFLEDRWRKFWVTLHLVHEGLEEEATASDRETDSPLEDPHPPQRQIDADDR